MTEMKINQQELMAACQEVIQYSRKMAADGLVVGTSGNVSRRIGDLIAITPSGVDYDILKPEDICLLELDGTPVRCFRSTGRDRMRMRSYIPILPMRRPCPHLRMRSLISIISL